MRTWLAALFTVILTVSSAWALDPIGEWLVENGSAHIRIVDCGGALWGVVSWEKTPGRDSHNPDQAKRGRPTLGIAVLRNMKPDEPGHWQGEIYNAKNGRSYDASIELSKEDILHVEGCALGILCGGEDWTRLVPGTTGLSAPGAPATTANICASIGADAGRPH